MRSDCSCASYDDEDGRWQCGVSGDGCLYLWPDSKRCAKEYGEGPDSCSEPIPVKDEKQI